MASWLPLHGLFRAVPRQHQKQNQPTQNKGKKMRRQIQKATLTLTGNWWTTTTTCMVIQKKPEVKEGYL